MFKSDTSLATAVIPARWYQPTGGRVRRLIVMHTMESPEKPTTAEDVSRWAQTLPASAKASWHYAVDADSIVQCVQERDVAYAAPGANHDGIQIEQAGRAGQGVSGWNDQYSQLVVENSARLVADICHRNDIPARWLGVEEVQAGMDGITSHAVITRAYPGPGRTHTDPGPDFPVKAFIGMVATQIALASVKPREFRFRTKDGDEWTGDLSSPAVLVKLGKTLTGYGKRRPFVATVKGRRVAGGRLWRYGRASWFSRKVAACARLGHQVVINDMVTVTTNIKEL